MQEELFGPILPVLTWSDSQELMHQLKCRPSPLALYCFSRDKAFVQKLMNQIKSGSLSVNIIPHTELKTTLSNLTQGDLVNLEFDMIGKYIAKALQKNEKKSLTINKLIESGW